MDNAINIHWTDDSELLERYALNRIEVSQRIILERHLADCEQCRKAVRREHELTAGIRLLGRETLKAKLRQRLKVAEPNLLQRYQLVSLAAAVVVIFIALGLFRFYFGSFEWPTKFSSKKYIVKQSLPDSISGQEESKPESDKIAERQPPSEQTAPLDNLAAESSAGAGVRTETALSDVKSIEQNFQPEENTRSFWLLGTVTVIHDVAGAVQQPSTLLAGKKAEPALEKAKEKKNLQRRRTITIRKDGATQTITLLQRPSSSLPESRKDVEEDAQTVQTLVERTARGLNITLYRDTQLIAEDIQGATVEPVTEDSLIVIVGNQRIAYRIPGGWSTQQSTKTNIDRR